MAASTAFQHRAFLSYSHRDQRAARRLHGALETFAIDKDLAGRETALGPVPKSLRPIFRDREDFSGGHALTDATLAALDASAAMIVLCSPAAAVSHYVNEEVRLFKQRHPDRPVIPVIAAGEPPDCFPLAAAYDVDADGAVTHRPVTVLAPDLRGEGDGWPLALAKVVAGLTGVATDEVYHRAERARRRRQRVWIAGLSVVVVALAGLAGWAEINRQEAVRQRAVAEEKRQEAERNFAIAKQGANALVFDIAQALRDQQGMRTQTVRKILGTAEQVFDKLVATSQNNTDLRRSQAAMLTEFAITYAAQGDTTKQEEEARKALAINQELAKADPGKTERQRDLSIGFGGLGDVQVARGDLPKALASYRDGLAIAQRLAKTAPDNAGWQRDMSVWFEKVGGVQVAQGDLASALASYSESLAYAERLAKSDPSNSARQRDLSVALNEVGDVRKAQGDLAGALASYRDSLAIAGRLVASDPSNTSWQHDLSISLSKAGDLNQAQGDLAGALTNYRGSLAILESLVKSDPANAKWKRELSVVHQRAGDSHAAGHDLPAALASYCDSLTLAERLAKSDPANAGWQRDLSVSINKTGDVQLGRHYRRARELPQQPRHRRPSRQERPRQRRLAARFVGDVERGR